MPSLRLAPPALRPEEAVNRSTVESDVRTTRRRFCLVSVLVSVRDRKRRYQVETSRLRLVPKLSVIAKFPHLASALRVRPEGTENPCVECSIHSLPTIRPEKNRLSVSGSAQRIARPNTDWRSAALQSVPTLRIPR